ncbi:MAG: LamG-like jellyroll fold domain-containing protein [Candidatus Paceibacterota bacterium]
MKPNSFTLIELVIVIAVLSILSAVVVITINPAEQMRSARDSRRAEELTTINKAISLYVADGGSSLGSTNTVYVSIPDSSATCANLGLPTLPTGWSYHCSTSVNLQKTDSTGWIPVNFSSISFTTPLSSLPVDPVNTTSTGNYYTYITGGSWELTSSMESAKYKLGGANDKTSKDGGLYTGLYELGTNLTLLPLDYGDTSLVGYWKFDEGTGTTAYDASGHNNNGTLVNSPTWVIGKIGSYALSFSSSSNKYVDMNNGVSLNNTPKLSIVFWAQIPVAGGVEITKSYKNYELRIDSTTFGGYIGISSGNNWYSISESGYNIFHGVTVSNWNQYAYILDYNASKVYFYANGSYKGIIPISNMFQYDQTKNFNVGRRIDDGGNQYLNGLMDDIRIYNRALSAAEILALYNATNK